MWLKNFSGERKERKCKQIWCGPQRETKRTECEEAARATGIGAGDEVENAGHAPDGLRVNLLRRSFSPRRWRRHRAALSLHYSVCVSLSLFLCAVFAQKSNWVSNGLSQEQRKLKQIARGMLIIMFWLLFFFFFSSLSVFLLLLFFFGITGMGW